LISIFILSFSPVVDVLFDHVLEYRLFDVVILYGCFTQAEKEAEEDGLPDDADYTGTSMRRHFVFH